MEIIWFDTLTKRIWFYTLKNISNYTAHNKDKLKITQLSE